MEKIKNENHIIIDGWMINELNLKGNELIVYALIYGFSQDGQSEFYGSRSYIAGWCNASLPTIDKALTDLVLKGLIIKRTETINNVTFNRYKADLEVVKNLYRGSKETLGGSKETLHNNIEYNTCSSTNKEIYDIFEDNLGRMLAPIEYEKIKEWEKDFDTELIEYALKIAVLNNKKSINYINAILRNWKTAGYKTKEDVINDINIRTKSNEYNIEIDNDLLNWSWFEE